MAREESGKLTAEEERRFERECWLRGDLEYLLRPRSQVPLLRFVEDYTRAKPDEAGPLLVHCHRRFGKTTTFVGYCFSRCLRSPGIEVRYGAPLEKQCETYVRPVIQKLLRHCPPELRPRKVRNQLFFRNPLWPGDSLDSSFTLFGCKENADAQRGPGSDVVILDEARDMPNLPYVMHDVFGWQFMGRKCPLLIIPSTSPRSASHPLVGLIDDAARDDRYFLMRLSENPDISDRDRRLVAKFCGGTDNVTWRREAECEIVSDESSLVIPEFTMEIDGERGKVKRLCVVPVERPKYYFPWLFMDSAFSVDYTAILAAWLDWQTHRLVVEDERFLFRANSGKIRDAARDLEALYFKDSIHPVQRVGDFKPQQLADLRECFGLSVRAADKYDRDTALSSLRQAFQEDRIRIHPRAKRLIAQVEHGIYDDKGDFVRTEELGHLDGIAALVYGFRMVNLRANPLPPVTTRGTIDTWFSPDPRTTTRTIEVTRNPIPQVRLPVAARRLGR